MNGTVIEHDIVNTTSNRILKGLNKIKDRKVRVKLNVPMNRARELQEYPRINKRSTNAKWAKWNVAVCIAIVNNGNAWGYFCLLLASTFLKCRADNRILTKLIYFVYVELINNISF